MRAMCLYLIFNYNKFCNEGEVSKRAKCLTGEVSHFTAGEMSKRAKCPVPRTATQVFASLSFASFII